MIYIIGCSPSLPFVQGGVIGHNQSVAVSCNSGRSFFCFSAHFLAALLIKAFLTTDRFSASSLFNMMLHAVLFCSISSSRLLLFFLIFNNSNETHNTGLLLSACLVQYLSQRSLPDVIWKSVKAGKVLNRCARHVQYEFREIRKGLWNCFACHAYKLKLCFSSRYGTTHHGHEQTNKVVLSLFWHGKHHPRYCLFSNYCQWWRRKKLLLPNNTWS